MVSQNWLFDRWNEGVTSENACSNTPNGMTGIKNWIVISSVKSAESAP